MVEDHAKARSHVKAIAEAMARKDRQGIIEHLSAYRDLLTEHIKKEDEVLYPWMDRGFSLKQVGELFSKFNEMDETSGSGMTERGHKFIFRLEENFLKS